jgi:thiol:disulfide interchange protein
LLDFYADQSLSCNEMEKLTFIVPVSQDETPIRHLFDVSANNGNDKARMQGRILFGPPVIICLVSPDKN